MLTFDNVYQAPLGDLHTAVTEWAAMVSKLERLAEEARTTLGNKARDEYWRGVNAEVTKPFIKETVKEFDEAAKAAQGIKLILEDGHEAFKKAQDELKKIVDVDAPTARLIVGAHGVVRPQYDISRDREAQKDTAYGPALAKQNAAVEAMQRRIDDIVENCNSSDIATSNALKANITDNQHNFSPPVYSNIDAEEAKRAVDLANKGRDLTHAELQQLNELLKGNHTSPEFSRAFYDSLGPKRSLEFFGQLSTDTYDLAKQDKERLADVQELQRNLGLNLATATKPVGADDAWTQKWSEDMRKLGTERIPLAKYDHNGPYGYQLLGGIMRYGNYDPRFLNPIAGHVTQLHARDPYLFADNKGTGGWDKNPFNPSGKNGSGFDPMLSMLEALGHSPQAAKEFFGNEPKAYNDDGTLKAGPPKDADGKEIKSYLDYFGNNDYESFPDIAGHAPDDMKKSLDHMPNVFGHALEAATLGHAYDDPNPALVRDADSVKIMEEVVEKYGSDPELLKEQEALADSLGRMGAGYIDDINWALNENDPTSLFAPAKDPESHAAFERTGARQFLSTLGQHPDAYASVATAERVYTTSMLEAQVGEGGKINEGHAREVVRTGAEVQGMLDQSRFDQVEATNKKKDEEYNQALEKRSGWINFGAAAVVGAGVAFLPATAAGVGVAAIVVPLAVDTGGAAAEQMIGQAVSDWTRSEQKDSGDDTEKQRVEIFAAGELSAESPMKAFLKQHGILSGDPFGQDLEEALNSGYNRGTLGENRHGTSPQP